MKKFLYTIGFLMFCSALFSPVISHTAFGQNANPVATGYDSGCTFPWLTCGNFLNIPDADWGATFGQDDPAKVGQNLYENILEMTRVSPDKKAFQNTAGAFGSTQSDMSRILNNDFGPILDKSPYLTQDQAIQKMVEIQQSYQDEKDIYAIQADIDASVTPNEIFEDGDTSNSGFDLINDLNNIENILFKKMDPIDIGGNFDASSTSGTGTGGGSGPQPTQNGTKAPGNGPSSGQTGTASSALGSSGGGTQQVSPEASTSGLGQKPSATDNPNICFADTTLDKALKDFENKKATDANYKETPTQTPPAANANKGSNGNNGTGENTGTAQSASTASAPFTFNPPVTATVQPAPASNWLTTPPCNDVLCIQVNFVKKPASAYVDSDNCIACHVEKINEKLKETINHSLIPGKATGNLLEPGICKQATADLFNTVGMRFYAVAKPVLTPTNDDLIYGSSMVDEWDKFVNTYKPFPFYEKSVPDPSNPNADTFIPNIEDSAAKAAVAYATPDTTIDQVTNSIDQQVQGQQKAVSQAVAVASPAVQSDTDSSFYQSIQRELEQMNYYFDSFQNILHRLHEKVGDVDEDHACAILSDIKQCQ